MNIDNGHIKFWDLLTDEERASGRWVKLGDGEFARAQEIDEHERRANLNKIFSQDIAALKRELAGEHPFYGEPRR